MVSIISWFINIFRTEEIIQVRRMPAEKVLRAHLLGLTLSLIFVLIIIISPYITIGSNTVRLNIFQIPMFLIIFGFGSYLGGPFLLLTAILFFIDGGSLSKDFIPTLHFLSKWYLIGYVFGTILATLYNDLLFLYLISFGKERIKIAFAYDTSKSINIIKSPIEKEELNLLEVLQNIPFFLFNIEDNIDVRDSANKIIKLIRKASSKMSNQSKQLLGEILEENLSGTNFGNRLEELRTKLINRERTAVDLVKTKINPLVEEQLRINERRLYDYHLDEPPKKPYTIAFVANPRILKRRELGTDYDGHRKNPDNYELDPIVHDLDLFLRTVDRALFSFEHNEVLGNPGIWSRVRILAIFDEDLANESGVDFGLVEEFQHDIQIDSRMIDNLIDPMEQMVRELDPSRQPEPGKPGGNVQRMFERYPEDQDRFLKKIDLADIDVIFALSAAPEHDRSTSHYSDYLESAGSKADDPNPGRPGKLFEFDPDPEGRKNAEINVHRCQPTGTRFICKHEDHAVYPGRVALNVIGARNKTFIHEFAHAMSSAYRGAITDEYADEFVIQDRGNNNRPPTEEDRNAPFYVNRIQRDREHHPLVPVHKIFAKYEGVDYHSDMEHPSEEEDWYGYFSERTERSIGCIMDSTTGRYRFDKLIQTFMYDRIVSKLNRPHTP